ncbi:MAG: hypothetical protein JSW66_15205 [Phycisphaerales bacterium]|nr:MAG: hypothetical protein JSW66_15205 [Phycisphaerales bacterium]
MSIRVKLADIIDGLESQSDESSSFLNKKTGEVVLITDEELSAAEEDEPVEDFPDWQQDQVRMAREIVAETGDYIELPTRFDLDEYRIMERFCLSVDDPEMCETLCGLIRGSGAFRRFKDAVYQHGIESRWNSYRDNALKEIAIEWCRENNIELDR